MSDDSNRGRLGFSLVEVLLSMVIVSIALLGILALQAASIRSAAGSRGRETAVYLCQTLTDSVQSEAQRLGLSSAYSIPASSSAVVTFFPPAAATGTLYYDVNGKVTTLANQVFTIVWRRQTARDLAPNCYEFVATATWSFETNASGGAQPKTVQINRLVRID